MALANFSTCLLGTAVGSAMLLSTGAVSSAFTLESSSPQWSGASVERVWWDQWGRWHPNHRNWHWYRRPWGPPPAYGYYAPPAFGVYVSPPPVYEYYGPRQRWGDEDE
jgi:hypothetical protein